MFKHNLIELPVLERIDGEMRKYVTPTGEQYPSVTTVLKHTKVEDGGLQRWRDRIGHAEADKITKIAASRGTGAHNLCEQFVLNQEIDYRRAMPTDLMLFKQIKSILEPNVDNIRISEGYLYSHKLKVAGAVDLVADYKNVPAIIDFKTSRTHKRPEWIEDYFIQATMYSYMLFEMTKLLHNKLVIIIACEEDPTPQVFETEATKWLSEANRRCKLFHQNQLLCD